MLPQNRVLTIIYMCAWAHSVQCAMQCMWGLQLSSVQGVMLGKQKSLMKTIELREKRKRRREEMEVVLIY